MLTRREVLRISARTGMALTLPAARSLLQADEQDGIELNDVQSQLNATRVHEIRTPRSIDDFQAALRDAQRQQRAISSAGGRHAMGGQQFSADSLHLDTTGFNRVVAFDRARGQITVEAGIEWPELIDYLLLEQQGEKEPWAIREKQTGVDRVSLGGSLSSNVHGRGLKFPPLISDIESFTLLTPDGKLHNCSRAENQELFSLAVGGFGLFGMVVHV